MVWRKKIKNNYDPVKELVNFIFKLMYSFDLDRYFKQGRISIFFEKKNINLIYSKNNIEYKLVLATNINNRTKKDEIIYKLQDFILNAYYMYEWNWQPMKLKDIAWLLLVSPQAIDVELKNVWEKMIEKKQEIFWEQNL